MSEIAGTPQRAMMELRAAELEVDAKACTMARWHDCTIARWPDGTTRLCRCRCRRCCRCCRCRLSGQFPGYHKCPAQQRIRPQETAARWMPGGLPYKALKAGVTWLTMVTWMARKGANPGLRAEDSNCTIARWHDCTTRPCHCRCCRCRRCCCCCLLV